MPSTACDAAYPAPLQTIASVDLSISTADLALRSLAEQARRGQHLADAGMARHRIGESGKQRISPDPAILTQREETDLKALDRVAPHLSDMLDRFLVRRLRRQLGA